MTISMRALRLGLVAAAALALPSVASAQQPLSILVTPLQVGGQIIAAPFEAFAPRRADSYDPAPARAAAVGYTSEGYAIVRPQVLKATGPRYSNPAGADYSRPYVLRPGVPVPGNVNTAPVENVSVPGLQPGGDYEFFVSERGRVVMLEPSTRRVVKIVR